MPRQRARSTSPEVRGRNTRDILGKLGLGGTVRTGGGRGAGRPRVASAVQQPQPDPDEAGAAQLLVLSATGASIASGGDYVAFDTILAQHGFEVPPPSGGEWVHPIDGVYVLTYEHVWDSYDGGGAIQLQVDEVDIPEGLIAWVTSGTDGSKTISYLARAGSVGRIVVTQSSGSTQTCSARAWVSIPDPAYVEPPVTVDMPTGLLSVTGAEGGGTATVSMVHGAPTGTQVGDRMMLTFTGYSLDGGGGSDGTWTSDPAWTVLMAVGDGRQFVQLYTKIADAADAAGTASYTWECFTGNVGTRGAVQCVTIPQANGTTITGVSHDEGYKASFSTAAPVGDWLFAVLVSKESETSGSQSPIPTLTSDGAVLLGGAWGSTGTRGYHRHYAVPAGAATVTGEFAFSTVPYGALMVVGVTE